MKRFFPLLFCMLAHACSLPLFSMDSPEQASSKTSDQIFAGIMGNTNPDFEPIRQALGELAQNITKLNQLPRTPPPTPLHSPSREKSGGFALISLDPETSFDFGPHQQAAQEIMGNIQKIHDLSKKLNDEMSPHSAQLQQHDQIFTQDEQRALQLLEQETELALTNDRYISSALGLGISSGASILLWITSIDPIAVYRAYQIRFPGIDIAMLATIKSLLGPIVCIICIAVAWYQFKQWIVEPYQKKHAEDIAELRREFEEHRKKTKDEYDRSQRQCVATRSDLMEALASTKGHLEREIKALQAAQTNNQQGIDNVSRTFGVLVNERERLILRQCEERNQSLLTKIDEQIEEMETRIERDQKKYQELVHAFTDQAEEDLSALKDSVKTVQENNLKMKGIVDNAVVEIGKTKDTMATLKEQSQELVNTIRAAVAPRKPVLTGSSAMGLVLPPPTSPAAKPSSTERKRS